MRALEPGLYCKTLPRALIEARRRFGKRKKIVEDPDRAPLSYDRLLIAALVLGRRIARKARGSQNIGVLLPNVNGVAVTLFGLWFRGLVPVMLNFTAGPRPLVLACQTAEVSVIVTSRRFVEMAKLDEVVAALMPGRRVLYLEDIRKNLNFIDKTLGVAALLCASLIPRLAGSDPEETAVILFTSGAEGVPKGVALSHANIIANTEQIRALAAGVLSPDDIIMNPLPVFHSFGLTAGLMLGLLHGMKVVLYPSPLHYKQVPRLIGETQASVLLVTDTFLAGYGRAAEPGRLTSLKLVVTGAERVKETTRQIWKDCPAQILEGYGCTECSPVLACNRPDDNRPGTVGRLLDGIEARLEPVEGIHDGGRLVVKGPNVMRGYILLEAPGQIQPPPAGWHDTGDIVDIDDQGFVTIKGRAKRFAKIGGEMVSLAAVEAPASGVWPGATHVAVVLPDPRKGEQIILVTDRPDADRSEFIERARKEGGEELQIPRAILVVGTIPVLGSGKIDYQGTIDLVKRMCALI